MLRGNDIGGMHAAAYGDRAKVITRIAEERKLGKRLVRGHPMIEAEVVYAANHEYCEHPDDFIARRTRLAFLDVAATEQALPKVCFPSCHQLLQGSLYSICRLTAGLALRLLWWLQPLFGFSMPVCSYRLWIVNVCPVQELKPGCFCMRWASLRVACSCTTFWAPRSKACSACV